VGRDALAEVLGGLEAARAAGFAPIKVNMVVMSGVNENEVDAMVGFCMEHGFVLRLIEVMPMGETGRNARYLDLQPIRERLAERFGLVDGLVPGAGPARYLQSPDGRFSVGFITPISRHFCATCNRVRLAVDGTLYLCLGQDDHYPFRPLLRGGARDEELTAAVLDAIARKPEQHDFRELPGKIGRFMNVTGG
jgi:cyclic pyranopterin phosphate synthase